MTLLDFFLCSLQLFVQSFVQPHGCHMVQQVIDSDPRKDCRPRAAAATGSAHKDAISRCSQWAIINQ